MFQNHSLLPWLTVYDNVRIAVDKVFGATKSRAERHDWTMHNLELVQMAHAKDKRPSEISGGMKQRVGIARALAMEPKVLLMDEPFGALDALTRAQLQDGVMEIHARLGNTAIMITHDVDEAVLLSDRIVMMTNGPAATHRRRARGRRCRARASGSISSRTRPTSAPRGGAEVPLRAPRNARSASRRSSAVCGTGEASRHRKRHGRTALSSKRSARWHRAVSTITVVGEEPDPAYNRVLLSPLLAGDIDVADVRMKPRDWYATNGITLV